ncbi:tRNA (N6-threonylcarbamoyladenosine(37)-N6)-methyltransferase TrmO [uncultured Eubacterium sp.]|uniref:tRNA (N6-threonylcarbamoyladenosine(37)-N6)-methyltransferase TrmO n=1 Tax=uncultured Eubacterium sp. TaxID=165185 RepID=UPI0025F80AB0|nr:tRNA (N6-threonylcarbamoyladenosine(37)-N6)-methyltransferase TrmO [uncultured Eubacterium sp.]
MEIKPIAKIINDYDSKFAVPRQSGLVNEIKSQIIIEKEYSNHAAFKRIEEFSHLWLIWGFSLNSHQSTSLTVRPPRLGGNEKVGVFATRSPFRPNPIGLSSVKLEKVIKDKNDNVTLIVSGADLVSGTPIYDIKPYITFSDCHTDAVCGFADENKNHKLKVIIDDDILNNIKKEKQNALKEILEGDPRPAYHEDGRQYGFAFAGKEIKFTVTDNTLTVTEITDGK